MFIFCNQSSLLLGFFFYVLLFPLWQYGLWSFQTGGTKLDRFLPKNQHTQRKLLNFENWVNGEVSKIGYHFRNVNNKKHVKIDTILPKKK